MTLIALFISTLTGPSAEPIEHQMSRRKQAKPRSFKRTIDSLFVDSKFSDLIVSQNIFQRIGNETYKHEHSNAQGRTGLSTNLTLCLTHFSFELHLWEVKSNLLSCLYTVCRVVLLLLLGSC
ncbi:hypothetical protein HELRODRAFT_168070 [Helobdella robusta]|uniref:Uncharacterized protein n=1 Tax=Helobdella robusta TaxID=6412 RepID=T1F048_HELRO|nr:hypothetical protein HELRODRAFT_168070 [Helobdella robusta]ESO10194.1 hypothetical protein HELRODRAFT_168070 [Helobdella robusta]